MPRVLVTGAAGFIGSHLVERLVSLGRSVAGLDSFDDFYDPAIKRDNLKRVMADPLFTLVEGDVRDPDALDALPEDVGLIVHLAARAGVRPSIEHPLLYQDVNVHGTLQLLEFARRRGIEALVFGSSSSVYGNTDRIPFSEDDPVGRPISPYAATKRAGELLCHTYHHLFGLRCACLRFFTVYGPRQRPDLAIHKFTRLISAGTPIPRYGDGSSQRDYTHIDDILQGIGGAIRLVEEGGEVFEIVNLGESRTVELSRLIDLIGEALDAVPVIEAMPRQPGDVDRTCADIDRARRLLGYDPQVAIERGIPEFVSWFRDGHARGGR
jgi:UDP-glucuronate 4-epimerase